MDIILKKINIIIVVFFFSISLFALDFQGIISADYYGDIEYTTDYGNLRSRLYFQPTLSGSLFNYAIDFELSANLYYDPLGDPDLMVQIQYYPDFDNSIELIYVPFPRPDYEPTEPINMVISPDIDIDFSFAADPYMLDNAHSFFLSYNHISAGFDLQLNYAFYTEQTPNFDINDLNYGASLTGDAVSMYTRNHTLGGAYGTSFRGYAFVEEVAFNLTEDLNGANIGIKNSDITLNSQITGTLPGGTFAQLNIIYQHIINFDRGDTTFPDSVQEDLVEEFNGYFNQPVQNIAFLIGHIHNSFFHDRLYLALNAGYFHPEIYLAPRIAFALTDGMKIEASADIKTGEPSDKFLSRGNLLDNYYVRLKYEY